MSEASSAFDTYVHVETAEAIDILLRPAGVFARARAYFVDWVLRLLWLLVSTTVMSMLFLALRWSEWMIGLFLLNLFVTMWLYPVLFEVFWHGQTPGKRMFQLQVISDNGAAIGWSASLLRNLLRLVDGLPFLYAFGMSAMLLHPQSKRIGDVLAATLVVHVDDMHVQLRRQGLPAVPALAPPVPLMRQEQQALLAFAERQHKLPQARRQELAELLVMALYGHVPVREDALTMVMGMALHVAGSVKQAESE